VVWSPAAVHEDLASVVLSPVAVHEDLATVIWSPAVVHADFAKVVLSPAAVQCNKGVAVFPSPAGMSLTKLSLAGNNLPSPSPRKVWSEHI